MADNNNNNNKTITCAHGTQYEVLLEEEDEVVCRVCGIVKREEAMCGENYNDGIHESKNKKESVIAPLVAASGAVWRNSGGVVGSSKLHTSLYLETEVGSKPDMKIFANRYIRYANPDLVIISNISQKLNIANVVAHDVWKWYRKLRAEPGLKLTKAKILVVVFWGVCKCYGHPISESRLLEAIKTNLRVRKAYSYLKSIMEASSYLDTGSKEMILKRMGFFEMMNGRIDEDDGKGVGGNIDDDKGIEEGRKKKQPTGVMNGNGDITTEKSSKSKKEKKSNRHTKFFLQNEILLLREKYSEKLASEIASVAKSLLPSLMFDNKECNARNPARAARAAIKMAERRCGVGIVEAGMQVMMVNKKKQRSKVGK